MCAECKQHDAALAMGNGSSQSVPLSCEKAYGDKMECLIDVIYAPFVLFIDVLRLFLLVGFIVPLGMLCCCTKNPHKVRSPDPAPLSQRSSRSMHMTWACSVWLSIHTVLVQHVWVWLATSIH